MNRFQAKLAIAGVSILALVAGRTAFAGEIRWATDLGAAQRQATQEGKLLLLHFQSKDCAPCRTVEATVFADETVVSAIHEKYVPVRVDVDELPEVAAEFQVKSWPTDVIVTTEGTQLYRGVSPAKANVYRTQLEMIAQLAEPMENPVADYDQATAQPGQFAQPGQPGQPSQNASFETAGSANDPYGAPSPYSQSDLSSDAGTGAATSNMAAYAPPKEEVWAPSNAGPAHDPYAARPPEVSLSQSPRDPMAYGKPEGAMAATPQFDAPSATTAAYGSGGYGAAGNEPAANAPAANPYQQVAYGQSGATPSAGFDAAASAAAPSGIPASPASFARPSAPSPSSDLRLGLEGNCPVSLIVRQSWTKGDPQFGAKHRGVVYLFADAASRDMFLSDPDAFSLAWQGVDAVELVDHGRMVVGKCEFGFAAASGIVLFSSEENLNKFGADKQAEDYYLQKMDEILRQRSSVAAGAGPAQR